MSLSALTGCSSAEFASGTGAAAATDGWVDPTIGRGLRLAGYDRTFAIVSGRDPVRCDLLPRPAGNSWSWTRIADRSGLVFERGTIRDDRVGNLLSRTPKSLQAAIASRYGTELVLVRPYQCRTRAGLCVGEFKTTAAKFHVTFGRSIGRSTFVTVWLATG
jgi:hypothetical protein